MQKSNSSQFCCVVLDVVAIIVVYTHIGILTELVSSHKVSGEQNLHPFLLSLGHDITDNGCSFLVKQRPTNL